MAAETLGVSIRAADETRRENKEEFETKKRFTENTHPNETEPKENTSTG